MMMSVEETLEDILSINPDELLPIVREEDDKWPSQKEISAQLEEAGKISKEAGGERMGIEARTTSIDKKRITPDRRKEARIDLDMKKKKDEEKKDRRGQSNSLKGSDTKHKVEVSPVR